MALKEQVDGLACIHDASRSADDDEIGIAAGDDRFTDFRYPKHERHAEFVEWMDLASFGPKFVDLDAHVRAVAALAKQWPRKPAVKRK